MFCNKCGKTIRDGVHFCPYCSAPVTVGDTGDPVPAPRPAPAAEGVRCPSCGKNVTSGFTFCPYCGQSVTSPVEYPPAPEYNNSKGDSSSGMGRGPESGFKDAVGKILARKKTIISVAAAIVVIVAMVLIVAKVIPHNGSGPKSIAGTYSGTLFDSEMVLEKDGTCTYSDRYSSHTGVWSVENNILTVTLGLPHDTSVTLEADISEGTSRFYLKSLMGLWDDQVMTKKE